jgi:hypothetical protein
VWKSTESICWSSPDAIAQVNRNLLRKRRSVLKLPLTFHPALSAYLYKNVPVRPCIELRGGIDLLARLSEIEGLHSLADLVEAAGDVDARLRLRSPAPHLIFNIPAGQPRYMSSSERELQHGESWVAESRSTPCRICGATGTALRVPHQY